MMMTLTTASNEYLAHLRLTGKPSSVRAARAALTAFGETCDFGQSLEGITSADLRAFVQARRGQGVSVATIDKELRVVRAMFGFLRREEKLEAIPVFPQLKVPRRLVSILSYGDETSLLNAQLTCAQRAVILLALDAGLRADEIRHLRHDDITWEGSVLRVGGCEVQVGTHVYRHETKTYTDRLVPMTARLKAALRRQANEVRAKGTYPGWLFPGQEAMPLSYDRLRHLVYLAYRASQVETGPRQGLHLLRRTFASKLLGAGVDIQTVKELGGWADLASLQRYLASTPGRKRDAIALLETV